MSKTLSALKTLSSEDLKRLHLYSTLPFPLPPPLNILFNIQNKLENFGSSDVPTNTKAIEDMI